jgi:hypothetical protein
MQTGNPNFYTAVYKDSNSKYWVYSHEGTSDIFAPDSSTQTTAARINTITNTNINTNTVHATVQSPISNAAPPPVQEPVTIEYILAKLRPYFRGDGGTTWNPVALYGNIGPIVFSNLDNKLIRSLNPTISFNSLENSVLDGIPQTEAQDSLYILKKMFENIKSNDTIALRSYLVIQMQMNNRKKLVATYDQIFLHRDIDQANSKFGVNLLVDDSKDRAQQAPVPGSTYNTISQSLPTIVQSNQGPVVAQQASVFQPVLVAAGQSGQVVQPVTYAALQQVAVAQQNTGARQEPVVQQVQQVLPATVAQQEPAFTTSQVSIHTTPFPIAQPNNGAQAASPSCEAGTEDCYVWKFTGTEFGTVQFNVPFNVMSRRGSVVSGQYKLKFVGSTHVTHINISSDSDSYDLAAIRPDKMDNLPSSQSTAVFVKTGTAGTFAICTIEVTHSYSKMKPGVYAEWIVPHIDTGRWVTTRNGDVLNLPTLIPKANTVSMDYRVASKPASVVSSFAPEARYKDEIMEHRINGLESNTVASKTGNNDKEGGDVEDKDAYASGYNLDELRRSYPPSKRTLNHIYFDDNEYKTNPHFRFRPPWWSKTSQNPQFRIACVGDSLTAGFPCSGFNPTPYPKLLEGYLNDVGISASVEPFGISGSRMWSGSTKSTGVVNYQTEMQQTETKNDPFWFGNLQGTCDLMIIWLGTNDTWFVKNTDQTQVEGDFESIMRYRKANHYLLVEIDGFRMKAPCPESPPGTINDETCKRDDQIEKAAECINNAIRNLEQKYNNVHVASIDFMNDRCPGGEIGGNQSKYYGHFKSYDGIAKSIFGRIMCHAIFHRETGDLRWVGAEPNKKLKKPLQSL